MEQKPRQTIRYTEQELNLIKITFADNEELLKAIRKVFLQLPLDPIDTDMLKQVKKPETLKVVRKSFLPTLDGNAPFHQIVDLWMTLDFKGKDAVTTAMEAHARAKLIEYIDQQLCVLEGNENKSLISFAELSEMGDKIPEEIYIDLTVRNTVLAHTEMQINQLFVLAGTKEETVEETRRRLVKDSSK